MSDVAVPSKPTIAIQPHTRQVRRKGMPVDLNAGTNGERTFLCYKRGTTNPITDIQVGVLRFETRGGGGGGVPCL